MTAFRIDRTRSGVAPRVYHESDNRLAVALILAEDDGTFVLFPVLYENVPPPLTGQSERFPDISSVYALLGVHEAPNA